MWVNIQEKTRATQNFNMAAIFQDGRHRVSWNVIFCHKWEYENAKCTFNVIDAIQMSRIFRNTSFALVGSIKKMIWGISWQHQKNDLRNKRYIWACRQFSWRYKYYIRNEISSIWLPISKMAAMGYPEMLSYTLKITADSQIRWFGKADMWT